MYTNTHREGRDSKRQAAGQSRGRLRQRRNSQMQQLLTYTHTNAHTHTHTYTCPGRSLYTTVFIIHCHRDNAAQTNMTTCQYLFC